MPEAVMHTLRDEAIAEHRQEVIYTDIDFNRQILKERRGGREENILKVPLSSSYTSGFL